MFARGNRQIVAFCLGFIFPPLWIVAAFLALPQRPMEMYYDDETSDNNAGVQEMIDNNQGKERVTNGVQNSWNWQEERKFLKARWWRTLNRIMSFVGILLMTLIVSHECGMTCASILTAYR